MINATIKKNGISVEVSAKTAQELAAVITGAFGTGSVKQVMNSAPVLPSSSTRRTHAKHRAWKKSEILAIAKIALNAAETPRFRNNGGMTAKATKFLHKTGTHTRTYASISTLVSALKRYLVDGEAGYLPKATIKTLSSAGFVPVAKSNYLSTEPLEA